jgi:hypothetical protein
MKSRSSERLELNPDGFFRDMLDIECGLYNTHHVGESQAKILILQMPQR